MPNGNCRRGAGQWHSAAPAGGDQPGRERAGDPVTGDWHPWPWAMDAEGVGSFYATKAEAVAAVPALQAQGVQSIEVGCAQINLMHHPNAFPNLETAFDPGANEAYAAQFLKEFFAQIGDLNKAVGLYHSATPELGSDYQRKVLAVWPEESQLAGLAAPSPLQRAWSATLSAPPPTFSRVLHLQPPGAVAGAHVIMLPTVGGMTPPGRRLAACRAAPIGLALVPPQRRIGG